jgi:hypothetical protein
MRLSVSGGGKRLKLGGLMSSPISAMGKLRFEWSRSRLYSEIDIDDRRERGDSTKFPGDRWGTGSCLGDGHIDIGGDNVIPMFGGIKRPSNIGESGLGAADIVDDM